jgi:RNA polymerase sigma-70 factor (ECF subfamily)
MSEDAREDRRLVERLRGGEMTAFEELYRRHAPRLYNLACRMLDNATDAEDALQDSFLQVFRKIDSFKGDSALSTWLYRLTMNHCLDRLRSRAGRTDRLTEPLDDDARVMSSSGPRVEAAVANIDLERAIAALPDGYRSVFLLHDVEGFDHREVGAILGIAEGTSKSQVHKARLRIREFLTRRGVSPRPAAARRA